MKVIDQINYAAKNAPKGVIDDIVYHENELGFTEFLQLEKTKKYYADVPLKHIVALGRDDFWEKGNSWRDAVDGLRGENWPISVFDYFEAELREIPFPAPNSRFELRLGAAGGLFNCGNGNHRLVAGKAWLLNKYNEDAKLKKVKISHRPLFDEAKNLFQSLVDLGGDIQFSHVRYPETEYEKVDGKSVHCYIRSQHVPNTIYAWVRNSVIQVDTKKSLLQRMLSNPAWYESREWITVEARLVKLLLDDDWLLDKSTEAID